MNYKSIICGLVGIMISFNVNSAKPVSVLIETDMGNDIDDALAMDIAYKAMDEGKINLLGVGVHKLSPTAADYVDVLNTWYGYPNIPIARSQTPVYNQHQRDYTIPVCALKDSKGKAYFKRSKNGGDFEDPVTMYRRVLTQQPDTSVVFVSLGFGTELAKLLKSGPDAISPLSGKDLVKQKVKYLSVMAGSYGAKQRAEYNVVNDIPAMKIVFEEWPTEIIQNPFEIGPQVKFHGNDLDNLFSWTPVHPVIDAYKQYMKMPYDRPTWDLLSIIYITNPEFFIKSEPGRVEVNEKGYTIFTPEKDGNLVWLTSSSDQLKGLDKYIMSTILRKPKKVKTSKNN